jgi:Fe-S-cluster containining protein
LFAATQPVHLLRQIEISVWEERLNPADRALVDGGLDVANRSAGQIVALMRVVHEYVGRARIERSVSELMSFLYLNLSQTLARLPESPIACAKGCNYCCTSWVAASAPEVLFVLKNVAPANAETVTSKIQTASAQTGNRNQSERLKMITPCPMLADQLCGVYDARPLVCRTLVSYDVNSCEKVYTLLTGQDVPTSMAYNAIRNVYALALAGALKREGLPPFFYEYNAALEALLNSEDAEQRWLSGTDLLADVQMDAGGDMFSEPWNRQVYDEAFA